ncbi:PAS domain-containing sensor histidine kinase [Roseivirga seohaensis]|uniref:PAS domain-containing sensor histidine kinase n=1 Tax=Roseivirga seohaensis TaxID=1914963 RepID=UPI00069E9D1A|nr:PAS domain-containing sensor histidine kinase [Roseivirga seohaensis]
MPMHNSENQPIKDRSKLFVEQAPSAIAMFDREVCYLAASQQWLKDYNLEGRDIIGKSHYDIFNNISQEWKDIHQECLKGAIKQKQEDSFIGNDGTTQWISWDVRPWYTEKNEIGGILMYTADITSIKKKEHLLSRYQELLEKTNEVASIGTWEVDLKKKTVTWSKVTRDIHEVDDNYTPNLEDGISFYKEGENRDSLTKHFLACIDKKKVFDLELEIITDKGNHKWVRTVGIPEIENNEVVSVYGVFQDIDEKTKANKLLSLQEEQFRQTFEFAANGMALVGLKGEWLQVNKSLSQIIGYSKNELEKLTFDDITHPDDLEKDYSLLDQLIRGKIDSYQMEKRYFHKNGHIIWVLLSVSMVKNSSGLPSHFVSQINNITERKQAQFELQESLSKLQGIQDASTQVSIIETDLNGIIKSFNRGAENLLGYSAGEMIDKQTPEIIHLASEIKERSKELSENYNISIQGMQTLIYQASIGLYETREWTYMRKDGSTFPVQLTVTAIKNRYNEVKGYLGVATDISNLKRVEEEVKSLLDVTQEQNERLLNFAHIVSHNLRSHSGNLSMLTELMKMEVPEATQNPFFPLLTEASENLKETIQHLNEVVAMSTKTNDNLLSLNLLEYIKKAQTNLHATILESKTQIEINVSSSIFVKAIPAYLESIFLNLISNAVKYRSADRPNQISIDAFVKKEFVVIKFTDNGMGMNMKLHGRKLFGMYKTFHGNEDARGIGLFITKNQIEAMNGKIEVESELNKGTTFKVYLKL